MTYFEFANLFSDETEAINFIVSIKYKDGLVCPKCGCVHKKIYHQHYDPRKLYCKNCNCEFSALVGTIFENTHLDIRMWLYTIILCMASRKDISALQLQKELGMGSYHSAWRMLHLIRKAMDKDEYKDTFEAIVDINKTYYGHYPKKGNKHSEKDKHNKRGRGTNKYSFMDIVEHSCRGFHSIVSLPNNGSKEITDMRLSSMLNDVCKKCTMIIATLFNPYGILNGKMDWGTFLINNNLNMTYSLGESMLKRSAIAKATASVNTLY